MRAQLRVFLPLFVVMILSESLFLFNLGFPKNYLFDETAYVPAAQQYLSMAQLLNREHPPLAKQIIALGMAVFGDIPHGWRIMSTIFGTLAIAAMYMWALVLFRRVSWAVWVSLVTLSNQMVYIQSRIAMLDIFVFAFLAWSLVALTASSDERLARRFRKKTIYFAGAMLGLAAACKWSALVPWAACAGLVALSRFLYAKSQMKSSRPWTDIGWLDWFLAFAALPVTLYLMTYIPILFLRDGLFNDWTEILNLHKKMWLDQTTLTTPHSHSGRWYEWPILSRPVWYLFEVEPGDASRVRAVFMLGNPWVLGTGVVALLYCIWDWCRSGRRDVFWIVMSFAIFYIPWAAIPKPVTFVYYYMPAACTLGLALLYVFSGLKAWVKWAYLVVAFAFFVYFFPISSAISIPAASYNHWMWFDSWR
ncbi:MAG: phospholipid carrier-dependent glycosyltransferase [Bdellovibrionales bacterium]